MEAAAMSAEPAPAQQRVKAERAAGIEVLDASRARDHDRWVDLWWQWPSRDLMAHPDYVRLFSRPVDRVLAATFQTEAGGVLFPFLLRPLAAEPWAPEGTGGYDLSTPYGYGGPFAWGLRDGDTARFWAAFDSWATETGIATSFARLSLFAEHLVPWNGDTLCGGPNVVRHVRLTNGELWNDYRQEARKYITRARECGVRIEFDPAGKHLSEFLAVYNATMDRRNASSQYYFPRSFFEALLQSLAGHFTFVHAVVNGQILSSEILLFAQDHAYSFLGGTMPEAFPLGANYMLKDESFKYCRDLGIGAVVLGGGYQPNDGILRYKRHFGTSGERPFLLARKTYDPDAAERLLEARRRWEHARGREWTPVPGFFPTYRS